MDIWINKGRQPSTSLKESFLEKRYLLYLIIIFQSVAAGQITQLVRVSSWYIKVMGLIPSQGTYKNQPMNASISGTTTRCLPSCLSNHFLKCIRFMDHCPREKSSNRLPGGGKTLADSMLEVHWEEEAGSFIITCHTWCWSLLPGVCVSETSLTFLLELLWTVNPSLLESGRSRYLVSRIPGLFQILHLTCFPCQFTYSILFCLVFRIFVLSAEHFDIVTLFWSSICLPCPYTQPTFTGCLWTLKDMPKPEDVPIPLFQMSAKTLPFLQAFPHLTPPPHYFSHTTLNTVLWIHRTSPSVFTHTLPSAPCPIQL